MRLGYRLMGRAPRSESVAVLGKRWIPQLLQNLQHGLLDQSVDDARNAEFPDPAVRLGYFDPPYRLRLIVETRCEMKMVVRPRMISRR